MNPRKRVAKRAKSKGKEQQVPSLSFHQLPHALLMDILSRLSMKTLLFICRLVCKEWLSIISDPEFARLHTSRSPIGILTSRGCDRSSELCFAQIEEGPAGPGRSDFWVEYMKFTAKPNLPNCEFKVINTCNGLLCLAGSKKGDPLYVCNPILDEFITIPPPTGKSKSKGRIRDVIYIVGLGFSVMTNEYKVLQMRGVPENINEAEIYTIGTGVWRSIGNAPWNHAGLKRASFNTYLHGALHWVTSYHSVSSEFESIKTFNYDTERFGLLPLPSHYCGQRDEGITSKAFNLGVVGGCLLLTAFENFVSKYEMWVMKDYGVQESWTKFLVIENSERIRNFVCSEPFMLLNNGEVLLLKNRAVVCYNENLQTFREVKIITWAWKSYRAVAYGPSFVSLYDVSKGEEVKGGSYCGRMILMGRGSNQLNKLLAEGSCHCARSGMSPRKSTELIDDGLPRTINSSVDLPLRIESECAVCGADLGFVFRGKGFPMCPECFETQVPAENS